MSLRSLHLLGSPVLRQRSAEVGAVDDEVRRLVDDMFETMDAAKGVGLAANQVGVARRVAVVDADGDRFVMIDPVIVETEGRSTAEEGCLSIPDVYGDVTRPERVVIEAADQVGVARRVAVVDADGDRFVMIDPVIVETEGRSTAEEGCLSIPDVYGDVTRPERVVIEAADQDGTRYRREATGLKARAIQHEIDHLDGILFLDHLSLVRRQMLLARYRREHKDDTGHTKEVQPATARSE